MKPPRRPMKDSGLKWVGQIPEGWAVSRNKYVMHKEKQINEIWHGENVLSLSVNGVIVRDLANPSGKMPKTFDGYQSVRAGDLLMCLFDIDVTPRCVGRADVEGVTSPAYSRYRVEKSTERNFVYYYYLMMDYTKELVHLAKNLRHALPDEEFRKLPIILPPLPEQRAIAARLDELTGRIESESKKIAAEIERLEQYKKSFITEAVCGRVNFNTEAQRHGERAISMKPSRPMKDSGIPWVGQIPEEWGVDKIKYVFRPTNTRGNRILELLAATQKYGMYPQSRLEGVVRVSEKTDLNTFKTVHVDDFVISLRSFQGGFERSDYEGVCSPAYQTFHATRDIDTLFFKYLFKSPIFISAINRITVGIREGKNINYSDAAEMLIAIPPLPEQHAIAAAIDATCEKVDAIVAKRKRQLDRLDALKRSLVYEYVTGKKEVAPSKF